MPRRNNQESPFGAAPEGFFSSDVRELPEEFDRYRDSDLHYDGSGGVELDLTGDSYFNTDEPEPEAPAAFDDNLADQLDENEQVNLGMTLWEYVETDLESRRQWEERMLDGLEIIGLQDIPDDAVAFEGAARVTHPGIAEAMVQFQARAMEELMPPEGPVKVGVVGKSTKAREEQARRVEDYMNYQLMEEDDEYYNETDDSLLYLPYAGSCFRMIAPDPITGKTRSRFIPAIDFIVPYWAKSLKTAPRYTRRYTMAINDYKRAVDAGYFIDVDFQPTPQNLDSSSRALGDVSDDRVETYHQDDNILELYEITIDLDFAWETYGDGNRYKYPYTVTFERETQRVIRIVRCWDENDPKCEKDVWYTHEKFLPGLGFYGWGYLHLIGGLGRAASGALRLLLDGSATASLNGGFKTRDARLAGTTTFTPGQWVDVDATSEELAKTFYSPPFKEPSPALFKTLEILVTNLQRFAGTTEARVGDAPATGPVGTMVALIEQSSKIFSGIHKRLHAAKRQEFKLIAKCNWRFMSEETFEAISSRGSIEVSREDFNPDTIDVIPVSDPNIFSSVQRIALAQAVVESVEKRPDIFPLKTAKKAYRNLFKALKVPQIDEYLPDADYQLDPVAENEAIARGIPVEVYREQDDASHLAVHEAFMVELQNYPPDIAKQAVLAMQAHIAAHMAQGYRKRVEMDIVQRAGIELPPYNPGDPDSYEDLPPDIQNAVSLVVAGSPAIAPPPPPPPASPEEDMADEAFAREEQRKDAAFEREERRKDAAQRRQMQREGLISDLDDDELVGGFADAA